MKKLTRKERVKAMDMGFKRLCHISNKALEKNGIDRFDYKTVFSVVNEDLNSEVIDNLQKVDYITVDTVRSRDFIDTNGVYHELKGKTYIKGNILIHDYGSTVEYGYAMNVYMINM